MKIKLIKLIIKLFIKDNITIHIYRAPSLNVTYIKWGDNNLHKL
jgi:hypothetical protein